jgi:hypothetical protein
MHAIPRTKQFAPVPIGTRQVSHATTGSVRFPFDWVKAVAVGIALVICVVLGSATMSLSRVDSSTIYAPGAGDTLPTAPHDTRLFELNHLPGDPAGGY